jgi:voltage-gated potassium channel
VSDIRSVLQAAGTVAIVVITTVIYYVLPTPGRMHDESWAVLFCCGIAVLGALIVLSILRLLRAGAETRVRALVVLLCITVLFFSWVDDVLAAIPGQFVSMHTKTDALYFSVQTLSTVGYGDVRPAGQLARTAVTVQIIFNLVFLGTAVAMITGLARARVNRRIRTAPAGPGSGPGPGSGSGPGNGPGSGNGPAADGS